MALNNSDLAVCLRCVVWLRAATQLQGWQQDADIMVASLNGLKEIARDSAQKEVKAAAVSVLKHIISTGRAEGSSDSDAKAQSWAAYATFTLQELEIIDTDAMATTSLDIIYHILVQPGS